MYRLLVVLVCSLAVTRCTSPATRIENVLKALEKVIAYITKNKESMNLDAVFCIVLAQAHIAHITSHKKAPLQYQKKILDIEQNLSDALVDTRKILEPTRKNSFFVHTVLSLDAWNMNITFKRNQLQKYNLSQINTYNKYINHLKSSNFESQKSDDCMIELLQQQKYCCIRHKCTVSHDCYMTMGLANNQKINPAYGVTHGLLFLQLARSQLCQLNQSVLARKIRRFCSYIYWEVRKNADYGFLDNLDDLLLEQVTLCGLEGYAEFLSSNIIDHIVFIQTPLGCFINGNHEELLKEARIGNRDKRESSLLDDGCIDHTTGLGVSALALSLRHLLQLNKNDRDYPEY